MVGKRRALGNVGPGSVSIWERQPFDFGLFYIHTSLTLCWGGLSRAFTRLMILDGGILLYDGQDG